MKHVYGKTPKIDDERKTKIFEKDGQGFHKHIGYPIFVVEVVDVAFKKGQLKQ